MIEDIGNRIQSLRLAQNLSLSELAQRAGVAKSYLSNVERNIQSNPSIQFLEKLANSLHVPLELILYGDAVKAEGQLDSDWHQLVKEAMASGISKSQFKEFLEFQQWKRNTDHSK